MVCNWLANSWVWARSRSVVPRKAPISLSSSASCVRSRSVVTDPIVRPSWTTGIRFSTSTRPRRMTTASGSAAAGPGQHLAQPALDGEVVEALADRFGGQRQQVAASGLTMVT